MGIRRPAEQTILSPDPSAQIKSQNPFASPALNVEILRAHVYSALACTHAAVLEANVSHIGDAQTEQVQELSYLLFH